MVYYSAMNRNIQTHTHTHIHTHTHQLTLTVLVRQSKWCHFNTTLLKFLVLSETELSLVVSVATVLCP